MNTNISKFINVKEKMSNSKLGSNQIIVLYIAKINVT